jgi:hypothetical protein
MLNLEPKGKETNRLKAGRHRNAEGWRNPRKLQWNRQLTEYRRKVEQRKSLTIGGAFEKPGWAEMLNLEPKGKETNRLKAGRHRNAEGWSSLPVER